LLRAADRKTELKLWIGLTGRHDRVTTCVGRDETSGLVIQIHELVRLCSQHCRSELDLIELLNAIGLPKLLGIQSAAQLFSDRTDLMHYTSVLRYPVTRNMRPKLLHRQSSDDHCG